MRVLILFFHGLGDQIMLSGALARFKKVYPDATIELMVRGEYSHRLWALDPKVERVWLRDIPNPRYWNPLAYRLADNPRWINRYCIEEDHLRSHFDRIIIPEVQRLPEALYDRVLPYGSAHKTNRMACDLFEVGYGSEAARRLGLVQHPIPYEMELECREPQEVPREPFTVLHPFSSDFLKPRRRFALGRKALSREEVEGLIRRFPGAVVVGDRHQQQACRGVRVFDLAELSWLLRRAKRFVGVDSGIAHLAAAAGCEDITVITRNRLARYYLPVSAGRVTLVTPEQILEPERPATWEVAKPTPVHS